MRYRGMFGAPGLGMHSGVLGRLSVMRRDSALGVMRCSGVLGVLDVRGKVRALGRLRVDTSGMMGARRMARARGMARRGVGRGRR